MTILRPLVWSALALLVSVRLACAGNAPPTPPPRPPEFAEPAKDAQPTPSATPAPLAGPAKDASTDLNAPPTPPARPAALSQPASDAPKPELTADEAVAKANAYLDGARVMSADFVQIGPDGQRSEGQLYVERPGRMLFRFAPPARLEIVADGPRSRCATRSSTPRIFISSPRRR